MGSRLEQGVPVPSIWFFWTCWGNVTFWPTMPPLCFFSFCHFFFSLSLLFQVIIMGFVCVTVPLVMQTERKSLYNKIWRSRITVFFFFWVGVLQCVTAKTKLPKATKKTKNKNDIKIQKKNTKKKCYGEKTQRETCGQKIVQSWFSLSLLLFFKSVNRLFFSFIEFLWMY